MFSRSLFLPLLVSGRLIFAFLATNTLQRPNFTKLDTAGFQVGGVNEQIFSPEDVECHTDPEIYAEVDYNSCLATFQSLNVDIDQHPGPQTWGGPNGAPDRGMWEIPQTNCAIFVGIFHHDIEVRLSYSAIKRVALTVLGTCSTAAGGPGRGGNVKLQVRPDTFLDIAAAPDEALKRKVLRTRAGSVTSDVAECENKGDVQVTFYFCEGALQRL